MQNFTIHKCKTKITAFNKANVIKIVQRCLAMICTVEHGEFMI